MSSRHDVRLDGDAVIVSLLRTRENSKKRLGEANGEVERARQDLARAEDRTASLVGLLTRVEAELDRLGRAWETCRALQSELVELGGTQETEDDGAQPQAADEPAPVEITGARSIALMRILASDTNRIWTAQEVAQEYGLGNDLAHGARIARAGLDFLVKKNVLAKIYRVQDGITRASYRITAPWTEA